MTDAELAALVAETAGRILLLTRSPLYRSREALSVSLR